MKIWELSEGAKIDLEVVWGSSSYAIPTEVARISGDHVMIPVFTYGDKEINLADNKAYRGMIFHVYYKDKANGRICWKSVHLDWQTYGGKHYYEIITGAYNCESKKSERRGDRRLKLDMNCMVSMRDQEKSFMAKLRDISQKGVAFYFNGDLRLKGERLIVEFDDSIMGKDHHVIVPCKCVRSAEEGGKYYGCEAIQMTQETVAYISLKTMEKHMQALQEKRMQEQENKRLAEELQESHGHF